MSTGINHTSACFNLWRQRPVESQTPAARRVKRSGGKKFSLGCLQAATSEFIMEQRKKKQEEKLVQRKTMMKNANEEHIFHHCYALVMKN